MTRDEYLMLVQRIRDADLESGKVLKADGKWYVEGKKSRVAAPVIKLPHWTEGTRAVVIEGRK